MALLPQTTELLPAPFNVAELRGWIEQLPVTQGVGQGGQLRLLPWELEFLAGAMPPSVSTAALSIARANGKTTLLAAVAAAALCGPLAQPRGLVAIVASSFGQGRVAFEHLAAFVQPLMAERPGDWRMQDTPQNAIIRHMPTGTQVRVFGSDPRRAHGIAPSLILADEPAQWPPGTGSRMFSALLTGMGKLERSKLVALGTRSGDAHHWFSALLDGGADYVQQHRSQADNDPYDPATWLAANPSLDAFRPLRRAIEREAAACKLDDTLLPAFRAYRLNQGVADEDRDQLIAPETWAQCEVEPLPDRSGNSCWGIDLGSGASQSAIAAYWPTTFRAEVLTAFPRSPDLATRGRQDNVGDAYLDMKRRGELDLCGERVTDLPRLLQLGADRFGLPSAIVADRWRKDELEQSLRAAMLPFCRLETRGMGWRDGGEDVRLFRRAAVDGRVKVSASLLLRHAIGGAVVVGDAAGNSKLATNSGGGRRARHRDDSVAALILAVGEGQREASRRAAKPRRSAFLGRV